MTKMKIHEINPKNDAKSVYFSISADNRDKCLVHDCSNLPACICFVIVFFSET